jgi:uncharacterized protein (TIGR03435 family)
VRLLRPLLVFCFVSQAQSPPAFEVASVKINTKYGGFSGSNTANGKFAGTNLALKSYIRIAYGVSDFQVTGPDWINEDRFDINAIPPDRTRPDQMMPMLQSLLAGRFELQIHRETRVISPFALVIGKSGLKVKAVEDGVDGSTNNQRGALAVRNSSMKRFAEVLSRQADRPVIDRTGRPGLFDLDLKWSEDDSGPSLFTAVQEQLGLRLNAGRFPVEFIVVDYALRVPTEN